MPATKDRYLNCFISSQEVFGRYIMNLNSIGWYHHVVGPITLTRSVLAPTDSYFTIPYHLDQYLYIFDFKYWPPEDSAISTFLEDNHIEFHQISEFDPVYVVLSYDELDLPDQGNVFIEMIKLPV